MDDNYNRLSMREAKDLIMTMHDMADQLFASMTDDATHQGGFELSVKELQQATLRSARLLDARITGQLRPMSKEVPYDKPLSHC